MTCKSWTSIYSFTQNVRKDYYYQIVTKLVQTAQECPFYSTVVSRWKNRKIKLEHSSLCRNTFITEHASTFVSFESLWWSSVLSQVTHEISKTELPAC